MRSSFRFLVIVFVALSFQSCATRYVWKSNPTSAVEQNKYYRAVIIPNFTEWGCNSFNLLITNLSKTKLEVDWNKTLFIRNNQTDGLFSLPGTLFNDRNNPKIPDIVFPNGTLRKTIWPNSLLYYSNAPYNQGWKQDVMPQGYNGVYLFVLANGVEITERLLVNLTATIDK